MQMRFANRDESAWERGELAYTPGDTLETAIKKAAEAGFKPGSNGYAAFITAFSRKVRSKGQAGESEVAKVDEAAVSSAIVLTPDFQRTGTV
jgi:hypothetical protein